MHYDDCPIARESIRVRICIKLSTSAKPSSGSHREGAGAIPSSASPSPEHTCCCRRTAPTHPEASSQSRLLTGIARAAEALLRDTAIENGAPNALRELGEASGAHRVYMFENHPGLSSDQILTSQRFEWCQEGITCQIHNPALQNAPFREFWPEEFELMRKGHVLGGPVRLATPTLRQALQDQGIVSFLLVPMVLDGCLFGFVGFDDCRSERDWGLDEREALKAFAATLGLVIQRQKAQQRIEQSERDLQFVLDGSNDGFWDWDIPTGKVRYSQRLLGMLGYAEGEWASHIQSWAEKVHPDDKAEVSALLTEHLESRTASYQSEHRLLRADGTWHWILDRGKVVERDAHGRPIRAVGVHTDIAALKATQQSLAQSETELRLAMSAARTHTFCVDLSSRVVRRKGWAADRSPLPEEESMDVFLGRLSPDQEQDYRAVLEKLTPANSEYSFEYDLKDSAGLAHGFRSRGKGQFDNRSKLTRVMGVCSDITERLRTEAALEKSTSLLRSLFDAVPVAVVVTDMDGRITQINRGAKLLFRLPSQEILGRPLADLLECPASPRDEVQSHFRHGKASRSDGTPVPVEYSQSVFGRDGRSSVVAVIRDITEQQLAAEQVLRALGRERELNRLRTNFITLVSHEFRTPLAHILMSTELLEDCYDQMELSRRAECYARIKQRIKQLTSMMQDVLTLGELETGKQKAAPQSVDLIPFFETVIREFKQTTGDFQATRPVEVSLNVGCRFPRVRLDRRLTSTILTNLLSNALKYSPAGSARIQMRVEDQGDHLHFEVEDAGIGVPPEDRSRLFGNFFRARNVGSVQGTGVGLTIVQLCAQLQGGEAYYRPATPCGSIFSVKLPLSPAAEEADHSTSPTIRPCHES